MVRKSSEREHEKRSVPMINEIFSADIYLQYINIYNYLLDHFRFITDTTHGNAFSTFPKSHLLVKILILGKQCIF